MSARETALHARLAALRERIGRAAERSGRSPDAVRILAVSKTFAAERVLEAQAAGLRCFGENRVQEATQKIPEVEAAGPRGIEWHLIGPLQRNKARRAAQLFDVIQSVDRPELAQALDRSAREHGRKLEVLLQINIDEEAQKAGALPSHAGEVLAAIDACTGLRPVGLMAIPRARRDPEEVRSSFARLRALLDALNRGRGSDPPLRELSMGMSADFEIAIEEGATWIRVGTAVFGERPK